MLTLRVQAQNVVTKKDSHRSLYLLRNLALAWKRLGHSKYQLVAECSRDLPEIPPQSLELTGQALKKIDPRLQISCFKSRAILGNAFERECHDLGTLPAPACAICGKVETRPRRLCVDHNHKSNRVRALLLGRGRRAGGGMISSDRSR